MAEPANAVVLVPALPSGLPLDVLFLTPRGAAVLVDPDMLQALRDLGVPAVELFASGDEYAAAVSGLSRDAAIAAVEAIQDRALAALTPEERGRFGVA